METKETRTKRKTRTGEVVTAGADKTIVLALRRRVKHRLYGKVISRSTSVDDLKKQLPELLDKK